MLTRLKSVTTLTYAALSCYYISTCNKGHITNRRLKTLSPALNNILDRAISELITQSLISHALDPVNWQQREYRRELFKLLSLLIN
jgi:hypothetical protein